MNKKKLIDVKFIKLKLFMIVAALALMAVGSMGYGGNKINALAATLPITEAKIVQVAESENHTLCLTSDGRVFSFGSNRYGQLGDGSTANKVTPTEITDSFPAGTVISYIAVGAAHSLAISTTGKIFSFGMNQYGQLGDGTSTTRNKPTEITAKFPAGTVISQISAGDAHTLALSTTGKVFSFGRNQYGQLGDTTIDTRTSPIEITDKFTSGIVTQISAGFYYSLALTSTGKVFAFGINAYGQLGDSTTANNYTPTEIIRFPSGVFILQISAGASHWLALSSTGRIFSLGSNANGRLGDGTTSTRTIPIEVTNKFPSEVIISQVSAGYSHSLALSLNGNIFSFGQNNYGQLGNGTTKDSYLPTSITVNLTAGDSIHKLNCGNYKSFILTTTGYLYACGKNTYGGLGNEIVAYAFTPNDKTDAFNLANNETIIDFACGNNHTLALTSNGRVLSVGRNTYGQLGNGNTDDKLSPIEITDKFPAGITISQIAVGSLQSFVLTTDGRVFSFGYNIYGQLGDGTTSNRTSPVEITNKFAGESITQIVAGSEHTLAISSTGRVFSFGRNLYSQLGDGTTDNRTSPVEITNKFAGENIAQIIVGFYHNLAISISGKVFSFGRNDYGQLGDGTTVLKSTPVNITDKFAGETISQIVAGGNQSLALSSTGKVFSFGYNGEGQLGDGTSASKSTPANITANFGDETITQLTAGSYHNLALSSTGKVFSFGSNNYGQLGNGTADSKWIPTEITDKLPAGAIVSQIFAGYNYNIANMKDGKIFSWGQNDYGEVGTYPLVSTFEMIINEKAIQTISVSEDSIVNKTYGDFGFRLNVTDCQGTGTLSFNSSDSTVVMVDSLGNVSIKKAGTAIITIQNSGNTSYADSNIIEITINVAKASGNANVAISSWKYADAPSTPVSTSSTNLDVTVIYEYKIKDANNSTYSTTIPTAVGNYTIRATYEATANYNAATATTDFTISKGYGVGNITVSGWAYGDTPNTPTVVSSTNGISAVTYEYKLKNALDDTYSKTVPTAVGNYTMRATFAATASYDAITVTTDFTISKGTGVGSITMAGWAYGDTPNTPTVISSTNGINAVTYEYKLKNATDDTYSTTIPTAVGNYTVRATFAATTNYNAATATADFTIAVVKSNNNGLAGGAVAGIAIGSFVIGGLGCYAILWFLKKKKIIA